jgi:magnesium-transporting ATPase (P-type)
MIFTTMTFLQIFHALAIRSNYESLWSIGVFTNWVMWGIIVLILVLTFGLLYTPVGAFIGLMALTGNDLLLALGWVASCSWRSRSRSSSCAASVRQSKPPLGSPARRSLSWSNVQYRRGGPRACPAAESIYRSEQP